MTRTGVAKPIYRALQLIAAQAGAPGGALPLAPQGASGAPTQLYRDARGAVIGACEGTVDVVVTATGSVLVALAGNFNSSFAALPAAAAVTLRFTGLTPPLPRAATLELIDEAHTNPMAAWAALGSPLYPNASEIAAEAAAARLVAAPLAVTAEGADAVSVSFALLPYGMARVVVTL
jgi:hypothetical protein